MTSLCCCCCHTGDIRVNEQPGLASLHTIFVRLHNVFEFRLRRRNPQWGREKLFQVRTCETPASLVHRK